MKEYLITFRENHDMPQRTEVVRATNIFYAVDKIRTTKCAVVRDNIIVDYVFSEPITEDNTIPKLEKELRVDANID